MSTDSNDVVLTDVSAIGSDLGKHPGGNPRLADDDRAPRTRVVGPTTVLASSFRVTDAITALMTTWCRAVAEIQAVRTGDDSAARMAATDVMIHTVGGAVAFTSERHLRLTRPPQLWDGLAGYYETLDGHVQFHTNFDHHRRALLQATGCAPTADRDDVARVVSDCSKDELEQRVLDVGGIAAALRTEEEWQDHPHAAHVRGRPPLLVSTASAGLPAPLGSVEPGRPLAGLRVLDMTRVIAGPVCTRILAAYGADVLRIGADGLPVVGSIVADTTLGKRFAHCDITTTAGRDAVLALAAEADVVVTGFRPGALAGHGLTTDAFYNANPSIVVAQLSAFGEDGPWGSRPGFDSITQSATGIVASETAAFGEGRPRPLPCQLLDHGSGMLLAIGVLSALLNRHDSGGAGTVTASLLTTRNWLTSLGRADPGQGSPLAEGDVEAFVDYRDSVFGPLRHARPPGRITGIGARWDSGPAEPGSSKPTWLETW